MGTDKVLIIRRSLMRCKLPSDQDYCMTMSLNEQMYSVRLRNLKHTSLPKGPKFIAYIMCTQSRWPRKFKNNLQ